MRIVEQKAKYFSPASRKLDAASGTQINANINEILCDFKALVQGFSQISNLSIFEEVRHHSARTKSKITPWKCCWSTLYKHFKHYFPSRRGPTLHLISSCWLTSGFVKINWEKNRACFGKLKLRRDGYSIATASAAKDTCVCSNVEGSIID